jgi:methionyl-tRNA synthetase
MYVWVDALTAYMTAIGYPDMDGDFARFWPADVHLIGKDIVRFHAVYWPAFLMSAKLPLPKQVFGHGFLLARGGEKMSKSAGNVIDPIALAERYGVDALRYFLIREISFGQDGSYSEEAIVARCNAELSNSFGNLAQRVLSLISKNCDGWLPAIRGHTEDDSALSETVGQAVAKTVPAAFDELALSQGVETWLQAVFACNAYIDAQAPWALRKTDSERMETVLATLFICIAQLGVAILPVIPESSGRLLDQMGIPRDVRTRTAIDSHWYSPLAESDFRLSAPQPLFPRLELAVEEPA